MAHGPGCPVLCLANYLRQLCAIYLIGIFLRIDADRESGEHPLSHVIANCLMLLNFIKNKKFDDRRIIDEVSKAKP